MYRPPEVLPKDESNLTLVQNVHPPDWTNPEPAPRYNLVVLGAGTAGLVTAAGAAGLGAKVALVERHLLGGDCLNVGCVPSKCVIRSSRVIADVQEAAALGVRVPEGSDADFAAVMARMRRLRARISHHDSARRFSELGVDVFLGDAAFTGADTVRVNGTDLRFGRAVIATGARAAHPPIHGLVEAGFLTNETVFSLTARPRRIAVIGAGPIGCELAQAFRRLGSEVTLFNDVAHILPREDADAAEIVQRRFIQEGVRLVLDAKIERVQKGADGKTLYYTRARDGGGSPAGGSPAGGSPAGGSAAGGADASRTSGAGHGDGGAVESVTVDEILVGAGRAPNVDGLGLEAAGVMYDTRRGVAVNDQLRTTNPRVYAAGDVCMDWKFTHAADFAARIVIQNTLFRGRKKLSALTMPWCTYTDPEVAHVGMYEHDAVQRGIACDTFTVPLAEVDRAIADGEEDGFVRVHVKKGTDKILGGTVVARHAGEMLNEITLAIVGNLGLKTIANVIHPYPTQAEAIRKVADAYNRTRLTPTVKKVFKTWLAWTR